MNLSPRQRETLSLVATGLPVKAVAKTLGIDYGTTKAHLNAARLKLQARSNTQAVAVAIRAGLI